MSEGSTPLGTTGFEDLLRGFPRAPNEGGLIFTPFHTHAQKVGPDPQLRPRDMFILNSFLASVPGPETHSSFADPRALCRCLLILPQTRSFLIIPWTAEAPANGAALGWVSSLPGRFTCHQLRHPSCPWLEVKASPPAWGSPGCPSAPPHSALWPSLLLGSMAPLFCSPYFQSAPPPSSELRIGAVGQARVCFRVPK